MEAPAEIVVFGLSHHVAPVEVREMVALTEKEIPEVLQNIHRHPGIDEVVILTTCNRTEIYAYVSQAFIQRPYFFEFLKNVRPDISPADESLFYLYEGSEAITHLFKVAAGMDSMIIGEPQILGQVKDAFRMASEAGTTGTILNKLFLFAIAAGKRVRSETALGRGAISVASATVELSEKVFKHLSERKALVIGAGETGALVAHHLRERNIGELFIANRTRSRAEKLAQQFRMQVVEWEELGNHLAKMDIIIGATSAPHYILTREQHAHLLG